MSEDLKKYTDRIYDSSTNDEVDDIDLLIALTGKTSITPDVDQAWNKIQSKINTDKSKIGFTWLKLAAAIVIALGVGFSLQNLYQSEKSIEFTSNQNKSVIQLPDGSVITLQPNATVKYADNFSENRIITLEGDAYFEVSKSEIPFSVQFGPQAVTVLGTKFTVQQSTNQNRVTVVEGKVEVTDLNESILLTNNQAVVYNTKTGGFSEIESADLNDIAWATEIFEFNETKLGDAVKILEKHFQAKIILKNETLANCTITGTFKDKSLNDIIKNISAVLNLKYSSGSNQYIIKGKGC